MFEIHSDQLEYINTKLANAGHIPFDLFYGGYLGIVFPTSKTEGVVVVSAQRKYGRPMIYQGPYSKFMEFMQENPIVKIGEPLIDKPGASDGV